MSCIRWLSPGGAGSIAAVTNAARAVAASYVYDAFGNTTMQTQIVVSPYGFTGREAASGDGAANPAGLYYYRARYYDPLFGRFLSEDPVRSRSGPNFYSYVRNRPTILRDPTGHVAWGGGVTVAWVLGALWTGGGAEGACFAVGDTKGNAGLLCCSAAGIGAIAGGGVSVQATSVVCPTCKTICDMEGGFAELQVFGGLGEGGAGGIGATVGLSNLTVFASGGPALGGGAGLAAFGGDCKLKLGGKSCRKCQAQR